MKNTLLVVLIIALCYDHTQAQIHSANSTGRSRNQGTHSNQAVEERVVTIAVTDGIAATDKLDNDISMVSTIADGAATTDKLADDLVNSLENYKNRIVVDAPAFSVMPVALPQQDGSATHLHTYTAYMKYKLQKPRPINTKKTGRLHL